MAVAAGRVVACGGRACISIPAVTSFFLYSVEYTKTENTRTEDTDTIKGMRTHRGKGTHTRYVASMHSDAVIFSPPYPLACISTSNAHSFLSQ